MRTIEAVEIILCEAGSEIPWSTIEGAMKSCRDQMRQRASEQSETHLDVTEHISFYQAQPSFVVTIRAKVQ